MSVALVEKIANAVLYEGYILYPYRSSAVKNRQRWNFGVICPLAYTESHGAGEACEMVTQCLAGGSALTSLEITVRFLRLVDRVVGPLAEPVADLPADSDPVFTPAACVEVAGRSYESWQEAVECEVSLPAYRFADLEAGAICAEFTPVAARNVEPLRDERGLVTAVIVRTQQPLDYRVETSLETVRDGLFRIAVRISNTTPFPGASSAGRDAALAYSLLSAHTILRLQEGEFVSLLEPAEELRHIAAACKNIGTWPVLAGEPGARDTVLSSPIILYDYPQVAPESPGDLFDGAEIYEILSLRILALTDEEKEAMRRSDDHARKILERTESLPAEHFMKLHGALRGLHAAGSETS